jgi:hypothetical protein
MRIIRWNNALEYVCVMGIGILIFWPPISAAALSMDVFRSDFTTHNVFVAHMKALGTITLPHFLYESLTLAVSSILSISIPKAGLLVAVSGAGATLGVLYFVFRMTFGFGCSLALALGSMLLSPISLFTPHHLYFGYIGLTTYFNPTSLLLKPLALAHLLLVVQLLSKRSVTTARSIVLMLLTLLTGITRPHYFICIIPALIIYLMICWGDLQKVVLPLVWTVFLPGCLLLAWQFFFTFISGSPDYAKSTIIFAPFAGMREHSLNLAPKLFASIMLPGSLLLYYRKEIVRTPMLLLPAIAVVIGLAYSYLFAEAGERGGSMNFIRAGEISVFLLTMCVTIYHVRSMRERKWQWNFANIGITILYLLSLASGIMLYAAETFHRAQYT